MCFFMHYASQTYFSLGTKQVKHVFLYALSKSNNKNTLNKLNTKHHLNCGHLIQLEREWQKSNNPATLFSWLVVFLVKHEFTMINTNYVINNKFKVMQHGLYQPKLANDLETWNVKHVDVCDATQVFQTVAVVSACIHDFLDMPCGPSTRTSFAGWPTHGQLFKSIACHQGPPPSPSSDEMANEDAAPVLVPARY